MTIRTLVLSGGGGRGAFHAGVYKYLSQAGKNGLDSEHQGTWQPEIVVGTSIGAVNGSAIAQGISAEALETFWLSLREHDIQGLPPSMGPLARFLTNWILKRSIGVNLPRVSRELSMSPAADESWPPLPGVPLWVANRLVGRWSNILDTGPLYQTLINRLGLDENKIAESDRTLLINATNVRTGQGVVFSNRKLQNSSGDPRQDISSVTIRRIIASCSIPLMYPWTQDENGELYWDGALVANTPLGAAFDAVRSVPLEVPMEIVIVLLNPWWDENSEVMRHDYLPSGFTEAATWMLDWTMLASFRVSLKNLYAFNQITELEAKAGMPQRYRKVKAVIVAPSEFLPVARIIDYDEDASRQLIDMGYQAAEQAFQTNFASPA